MWQAFGGDARPRPSSTSIDVVLSNAPGNEPHERAERALSVADVAWRAEDGLELSEAKRLAALCDELGRALRPEPDGSVTVFELDECFEHERCDATN